VSRLRDVARRLAPYAPALVYAGLLAVVYARLWTPFGARGAWRYDPRHEYWGDLIFQARTLADGGLALWNPFDRAGFPLVGDPQPGLLYPPNWPIVLWGALTGDVPFALVSVKILAHALFGALGAHHLARRLGAGPIGAYGAGVLVAFTSPRLRYGGSALGWSIAWMPWLALAALAFLERPTRRHGVLLGAAAAMVLLAGAPAVVVYAALVALPLALAAGRRPGREALPGLAIAALTAAALAAPLVAGTLAQLPETVREARDVAFATGSAFRPGDLVGFLIPGAAGENPYVTAVPLLGAIALAWTRPRLAVGLLAIAALGIVLALGEHAGVLDRLVGAVPIFGLFRQAHRYLFVASIALALLGGVGLGVALAEADPRRRAAIAAATATAGLAIAVGLFALLRAGVVDGGPGVRAAYVSIAIATGLWVGALRLPGRWRTAAGALLVALTFVGVWRANADLVRAGLTPPPTTARDGELAGLELGTAWRIYDHGRLGLRAGTRLGVRDFGGYEDDPLGLSRYALLRRAAQRDPRLLGHANVRYVLEGDRARPLPRLAADAGREVAPGITELAAVAPAVYWVPTATPAADARAALAALRAIAPGAGAVIEGAPLAATSPATTPPVAGRIESLAPNRVVATIDVPGPGLVVIAEAYFPGWRATVDGAAAELRPANVLFRGVPIATAGGHTIELTLRPARFWVPLPLALLATILAAAAAIAAWRDQRRRRGGGTGVGPATASPSNR
jgi:hypothetical protein